jgi:cysteinyl-tRNA synthetase
LGELGQLHLPEDPSQGISPEAWSMVIQASAPQEDSPPAAVSALAGQRAAARLRKDFAESDRLREQIAALGWQVQDDRDGQKLSRA